MLGYGIASAQTSAMGAGTPTTASNPYTKICGDHPCKPGEVYMPGGTAAANTTGTNATTVPAMNTTMNMSANVTATKTVNGTMANATMTNGTKAISAMTNGTMASAGMKANATGTKAVQVQAPEKQVSSGISPADVKCASGYQLVLNKFDSRPACVTSDVAAKLVTRGWAVSP